MTEPLRDYDADRIGRLERRVSGDETRAGTVSILIAAFSVVALLVSAVGIGLGMRAVDESKGGGSGGGGGAQTVDVELGDLYIKPSKIEVPAGTKLTVNVMNHGSMQHDFKLNGEKGTKLLDPGASETVELGTIDADAQAWCTVPGHKQAGMVTDIVVTGAAAATGGGTQLAAADSTSGDATIDVNATPADLKPFDPTLAPAPGGTEHAVTMHATEKVMEVAPGVTQEMWTFDDQVPGPILRGKVGDLFTITLVNDGKMGHSIDFHASQVAPNVDMRTIQPGESLVYQYKAERSGIFMYHCGTAPALHHIGNGMYGAVVIDPPDLAPVDQEFVLVQSELYLGPQGQPGDLAKMQSEDADAVVFNGYVNQYKTSPIQVHAGERIRVWVLDAGPNENSAFHIVGTIFDTVYKEGAYLLKPGPEKGGSQVLDLQPAQGGFVELTVPADGQYPIVTHKFANVGKGALGLLQAGAAPMAGMSH